MASRVDLGGGFLGIGTWLKKNLISYHRIVADLVSRARYLISSKSTPLVHTMTF